jgi:diguanylate cyclase (GGDEF)-like protein/PAS domain S-box-containing protein
MPQTVLLIMNDPASAQPVIEQVTESGDFTVEWHRHCADAATRLRSLGKGTPSRATGTSAVLIDVDCISDCEADSLQQLFSQMPKVPIVILTNLDESPANVARAGSAPNFMQKSRMDGYLLPKLLTSVIGHATTREDLFSERGRSRQILDSIGDAVLTSDIRGCVTYLNGAAERLTGWSNDQAVNSAVEDVLRIVDAGTRQSLPSPVGISVRENRITTLPPDCILIRRDGAEAYIEDSTSPIRDRAGAVMGAVMTFRDVTVARTLSVRMSYLAHHDSLTDLPNRLLLRERLGEAIAMAKRHSRSLALISFDVDRFKHINDSLGHPAGDNLLQVLAQRLRHCVRESDTVSRTGGDEFAVLLPEIVHPEDAAVTARKMLETAREVFRIAGSDVKVTGSAGIATYPGDGLDEDSLSKSADDALYHSKESGRDCYQFFSPDMNTRAVERQILEADLRCTVDGQQFVLHYQPKVNLATGRVVGVEALIRWYHPKRGMVLPTDFIQMAVDTALVVPIGRWVLREACRQARAWHDHGCAARYVAINVSAVELRANGFIAGVRSALEETGLDPGYLEIELTESHLVENSRATAVVLGKVKDLGVSIALDDFGTGYASLSYLRQFPVDSLKIDQSFVQNIASTTQDPRIVEAIINLGKNLHLRVVAEGVETAEQLTFLRKHDCPEAQGFYLSPAVPAAEVAALQTQGLSQLRARGAAA